MAPLNSKLVLILIALSVFMVSTVKVVVVARELTINNKPGQSLATRLNGEGGGGLVECWNALLELRSCTNEIILFFLDGEQTYLGLECCKAIRIITRQCWPSMLTSLGFTSEEGDILRGYCDASSSAPPLSVTTLPPVQSPAQSPFLGPNPPVVLG